MSLVPTTEMLEAMFGLQESFNVKVDPNWKKAGYAYTDAIWTEAAEAFNYTDWPWWKKTGGKEINYYQVKMELIDIWHFLMSEIMTHELDEGLTYPGFVQAVAQALEEDLKNHPEVKQNDLQTIRAAFRGVILTAVTPEDEIRTLAITSAFVQAMYALGMNWDEVYKMYVGKNILNGFRQEHGYKKETQKYLGVWASEKGWEDNNYLEEILKVTDIQRPVSELQIELNEKLSVQYKQNSEKWQTA